MDWTKIQRRSAPQLIAAGAKSINEAAKNRSKETAMSTRRYERIALTLLLVLGGAALGISDLIEHAQAQSSSSGGSAGSAGPAGSAGSTAPAGPPPTTPTQSPTVNPSSPNTVQQPSSTTPSTSTNPSTPGTTPSASGTAPRGEATAPANETTPSTPAPSERRASTAKPRSIHHHYRARPALLTYSCSYLGCVRTYSWAFPCQYYSRYC
jgi:hypothetical protein